jgi:hypothetical protein
MATSPAVQKESRMVTKTADVEFLFASPRIVTEGPPLRPEMAGTVILRSAEALGDYPTTVVHSLRD